MTEFNLLAAACESRSRASSAQRLLNLYPEQAPDQSVALYGTPGLSLYAEVGSGPIRGMIAEAGCLYIVSYNRVYKLSVPSPGTVATTLLGSITSTSGMVSLASNGTQIHLADGTADGYTINVASNTLSIITDPDYPGGVTNTFADGFILVNAPNTGRVYSSEAYAADTYDGLKFLTSEGAPDNAVAILSDHREVWVFNTATTEVLWNAGSSGMSFERIQGAFIEHGCAAAYSPQKIDNTVFWLGQDDKGRGVVWKAEGYTPRRVSTHEIEARISTFPVISDAVAWSYQQDGHTFYVLNFPSGDATFVYDAATDKWHERGWFRNGVTHRHRGQCHVLFNGVHIVSDWENGKLYTMEPTHYSDNGDEICRELITTHLRTGSRGFYGQLEVRMETGQGLLSGQGSDPQILLSTSEDQGQTFGSWQARSMGRVGQYLQRAVWQRIGSGYSKTFRLRITDPIKVVLTGASVEVKS